jgi:serine-type D-Ala-D-Ala carboxypeptidase (penicillin-binding protein 5/6)
MRQLAKFLTTLCFAVVFTSTSFAAKPVTNATTKAPAAAQAAATASPANPWASYMVPSSPDINATGYALMDVQSGTLVASKKAHVRIPPASLTKLMTIYIVFGEIASGHIHLDDKVLISHKAWQTGGSRMFVKVGSRVSVEDLIQGVVVQSGNDATMALAEYVAGTEKAFVQIMDQQAQVLGMKDSHFSDPTGLPAPDHYATPYDLALLARAIITHYPQYYHYFGEKWFTWNKIRQPNRNRLLWRTNLGADGLKTGHTAAAGYCLISSAKQDNTRFVSVVVGAPSDQARADDSQALLNYGFRFFESSKIYNSTDVISKQRIWKGSEKYVNLGVANDFYVSIPRRAQNDLRVTLNVDNNIKAPVTQGQSLGTVNVFLKDTQIASEPLVAEQAVPLAGWWSRFFDAIFHWFYKLFHKTAGQKVIASNS